MLIHKIFTHEKIATGIESSLGPNTWPYPTSDQKRGYRTAFGVIEHLELQKASTGSEPGCRPMPEWGQGVEVWDPSAPTQNRGLRTFRS